jgi:nucleolar protein 12
MVGVVNRSITSQPSLMHAEAGDASPDADGSSSTPDATVTDTLRRTVFVGNVPATIRRRKLEALFRSCGKILSSRLRSFTPAKPNLPRKAAMNQGAIHPTRRTCNAFLVFEDDVAVERALLLNGTPLETDDGSQVHMRVDRCYLAPQKMREQRTTRADTGTGDAAAPSYTSPDALSAKIAWDHRHSIFIGNVPFTANEEEIRSVFSDCGAILNVRIVRDAQTGMGKGFAYVTFAPEANMDLALSRHETVQLHGRLLRVERSVERLANRRAQHSKTDSRSNAGNGARTADSRRKQTPRHKGRGAARDSQTTSKRAKRERSAERAMIPKAGRRKDAKRRAGSNVASPVKEVAADALPPFAGRVADPSTTPFSRPKHRRRKRGPGVSGNAGVSKRVRKQSKIGKPRKRVR